jgi:hypothetical protein
VRPDASDDAPHQLGGVGRRGSTALGGCAWRSDLPAAGVCGRERVQGIHGGTGEIVRGVCPAVSAEVRRTDEHRLQTAQHGATHIGLELRNQVS